MKIKYSGIALIVTGIILIGFAELKKETRKNSLNLSPDRISKSNEESYPYPWSAFFGLTLLAGGVMVIEPEKKTVRKKSFPVMQENPFAKSFPVMQENPFANTFLATGTKRPRRRSYNSRIFYLRNEFYKPDIQQEKISVNN